MSESRWTDEQLADLEETISKARESGVGELAKYWEGIKDGSIPTTEWNGRINA